MEVEKCIFESDAKLLVDALSGCRGRSYFDIIILDCLNLFKHFEEVLDVFVYRFANNVAHKLGRAVYSMSIFHEWIDSAPKFIRCNIAIENC